MKLGERVGDEGGASDADTGWAEESSPRTRVCQKGDYSHEAEPV